MKKDYDKIFDEIIDEESSKKVFDKYYIPKYKIIVFLTALRRNKRLIENLVQFLENERSSIDNFYTEEFLIILLIFRSFFQINTNFLKKVITAPENQLLNRFFKALTPSINVSRDHLNKIKRLLIPIKEEFVNCILKLEEDYIKVQHESLSHY